jgi:hypothetical protein
MRNHQHRLGCLFLAAVLGASAQEAPPVAAYRPKAVTANLAARRAGQEIKRAQALDMNADLFDKPHARRFAGRGDRKPLRVLFPLFNGAARIVDFRHAELSKDGRSASWTGSIEGDQYGAAVMVHHDDVISGHLFLGDGRVFEVVTQGSEFYLQEFDATAIKESAADALDSGLPPSFPLPDTVLADDGNVIDVMVVYTAATRSAIGGEAQTQALVREGVALANQAYTNSGINQRLRLAFAGEVPYTESGDISTDLDRLTNPTDGFMDNVHQLRDQYGADFVSLWISKSDDAAGLGWLNTTQSAAFARRAFNVCDRRAAVSNLTFPHELGHNMGSTHDRDNSSGAGLFPYSYGYQQTTTAPFYRTVMAYACSAGVNCPRVPYFSNPDVRYAGSPTGLEVSAPRSADNRRTLNESVRWTANFRSLSNAAAPAFVVNPTRFNVEPAGGAGNVDVTATAAWSVQNSLSWVRITSGNTGSGNGRVSFTVAANSQTVARSGSFTIGAESIAIVQAANETVTCTLLPIAAGSPVDGALASNGCVSALRPSSYAARYVFNGVQGQQVAITATSRDLDPYLYLVSPDGTVLQENDDSGGSTNARIPVNTGFYTLPVSGLFTIEVSTFAPRTTGNFSVSLTTNTAACTYTLNPASARLSAGQGQGVVNVTTQAGCVVTAVANSAWILIRSAGEASGSSTVVYEVRPNTGIERTGTITISGRPFTLTQAGQPAGCAIVPIAMGQILSGALTATSCLGQFRQGTYYASRYRFSGVAGQRVQMTLTSPTLDTYLYLIGPDGQVLAEDDDAAGDLNSRIPSSGDYFGLPVTGDYILEATTFEQRATGAITLTVTEAGAGAPVSGVLTSGQPYLLNLPPVDQNTLFDDHVLEITVPEGARRLEVRTDTADPAQDIDLFVRYGSPPTVQDGRVVADHISQGATGIERVVVDAGTQPALRPGKYYVALAQFTLGVLNDVNVIATVESAPLSRFTLRERVVSRTAPNGCNTPTAVDTFAPTDARAYFYFIGEGSQGGVARVEFIDPQGVRQGNVTFDAQPEAGVYCRTAQLSIASTPNATRLGRWTIRALWNDSEVTTATFVIQAAATVPPAGSIPVLVSGRAQTFSFLPVTVPTLLSREGTYQIVVPADATRLEIRLSTTAPANADLDLYARFGQPPAVAGGQVVADHASESASGNELIVIDRNSSPPLRAGTYYISLSLYSTGVNAQGNVTATFQTPGAFTVRERVMSRTAPPTCVTPAAADTFLTTDPRAVLYFVGTGTRGGVASVQFVDPSGAVQRSVTYEPYSVEGAACFNATLDIAGTPNAQRLGRWTARAFWNGSELFALNFTLAASGPSTDFPVLTPGTALTFNIAPLTTAPAFGASYILNVPPGFNRMDLSLVTTTPGVDVDLYVRYGQLPTGTVYDHLGDSVTGSEFITVNSSSIPPLRAGTYYLSLAVFSANVRVTGTLRATLSTSSNDEPVRVKVPRMIVEQSGDLAIAKDAAWLAPDRGQVHSMRVAPPPGSTKRTRKVLQ